MPCTQINFFQAAGACTNAGKRLCAGAEWLWACEGGTAANAYPYGDIYDGGDDKFEDCWTGFRCCRDE
jgi:formylglycine-generating enzyme required for sulfatase activity